MFQCYISIYQCEDLSVWNNIHHWLNTVLTCHTHANSLESHSLLFALTQAETCLSDFLATEWTQRNSGEVKVHGPESTNVKDCQSVTQCHCIITSAYKAVFHELSNLNFPRHTFTGSLTWSIYPNTLLVYLSLTLSIHPFLSEQSNKNQARPYASCTEPVWFTARLSLKS